MTAIHWNPRTIGCAWSRLFWQTSQSRRTDALGEPAWSKSVRKSLATMRVSSPSATSLGPRCAIATSTATIRVPVDHPTIRPSTIANVSGTAREKSRPAICEIFPKKNWKQARLPTSRHPGERIRRGAANSRCDFSNFRAVRASVPQSIPLRRPSHPAHATRPRASSLTCLSLLAQS